MKKKIAILIFAVILIISVAPICVSACGGFVALRDETIFHSVYCDEIIGADYKSLIWFNTASDAEVWGYTMCEECSGWHDYDFHTGYCDYFFETDDPLLITAMEISFEYGSEGGYERGREHEREEHYGEYEQGYEKGYEEGRYRGRIEAEEEADRLQKNAKEERRQSWYGLFGTIGSLYAISYIINWLDSRKKK